MSSVKSLVLNILRVSRKILKIGELSTLAPGTWLGPGGACERRDEHRSLISGAAGRLSKIRLKRYSQIANIMSLMLSVFGKSVNEKELVWQRDSHFGNDLKSLWFAKACREG